MGLGEDVPDQEQDRAQEALGLRIAIWSLNTGYIRGSLFKGPY